MRVARFAALAALLIAPAAWAQTSVQYREDSAHVSGQLGQMLLCVRDDSATGLAGTNGDYIPCTTTSAGRIWVAADTELPSAATMGDNDANGSAPAVAARIQIFDGSQWDRWTGAVSQSGTWTVQPGNTANTTPWLMTISEGGASAQVTATSGGSLQVECTSGCGGAGGTSEADDSTFAIAIDSYTPVGGVYLAIRDAVSDTDGGAFAMSAKRAMFVVPETAGSVPLYSETNGTIYTEAKTVTTIQGKTQTTTEFFVAAADNPSISTGVKIIDPAVSAKIRVSHMHFTCDAGNDAAIAIRVYFGTSTTPPTKAAAGAAKVILSHPNVPAGGGIVTMRPGVVEGAADDNVYMAMDDPSVACALVVDYEEIS